MSNAVTWGCYGAIPFGSHLMARSAPPPDRAAEGWFLAKPAGLWRVFDRKWSNLGRWVPALSGKARVTRVTDISTCACPDCTGQHTPKPWREAVARGYSVHVEWIGVSKVSVREKARKLEVWGAQRDELHSMAT